MKRALIAVLAMALGPVAAWGQTSDTAEPMQRKATEATAERLLDDSLMSNPEKRARAAARLAEPVPETSDPETLAQFFYNRGQAAVDLGRQAEAVRAFRKAAGLIAPGAYLRSDIFYNLAQAEANLGRVAPAIADYREATKTVAQNNQAVRNLALIAEQYAKLGDVAGATAARDECEAMSHKAMLDRSERNPTASTWRQTNEMRCNIAVLVAQGKLAEAEPLVRKTIVVYENNPNSSGGPYIVGNRHQQLAENLRQQGRLAEAENEVRVALNIYQNTLGATSQRTGSALLALGRIIAEQGRMTEGEALARKGIGVMQAAGVAGTGTAAGTLGDILAAQYRWAEARAQYTVMKDGFADDPEGWDSFTRQNTYYALALLKTGDATGALDLFRRIRDDYRAKLGDEDYAAAQARGFMAIALTDLGRHAEALAEFARRERRFGARPG